MRDGNHGCQRTVFKLLYLRHLAVQNVKAIFLRSKGRKQMENIKGKIGIVTIQSFNFGNRLQNYALQQVLVSLGYEVETIQRKYYSNTQVSIIKMIFQKFFHSKGEKFRQFDKLIHASALSASSDSISPYAKNNYDFFVAGSDQLWNPTYDFVGSVDFLAFADNEQKIAYAASFGVSQLPEQVKEQYAQYLNGFQHVSFREKAGQEIYKELTGKDAPVVLDPTMLLTVADWRKAEKKVRMNCTDYVLVYSLSKRSDSFQKKIEELSVDYKIVDIRKKRKNGHEWEIGPSEFIYLIDHAAMVLTDSFHATAFSILFHKPFIIFDRDDIDGSTRIDTLLQLLHLNKQNQKYENLDKWLNQMRQESFQYLDKALCSN